MLKITESNFDLGLIFKVVQVGAKPYSEFVKVI